MIDFDMSDVISLCDEPFDVCRREESGMFIDGLYYKDNEKSGLRGNGSFQPVSPEEINRLPELGRTDDVQWLYTPCRLNVGGALKTENSEEPDRVTRCTTGITYEPKGEENWNPQGNFYKYLLVRVGQ